MKRVLILGTTGFVGGHVVKALAESGWAVPIAGTRREGSFGKGVETVRADATNEAEIARAAETSKADAIVNCVLKDAETVTRNAEALFRVAGNAGIPVVYFSSMAVYGTATGVVHESDRLLGDSGWYSKAKADAEAMASAWSAPVTIFRPGCIYGARSPQWTVRIAKLLREGRIGDLGPGGDGRTNLVHINDLLAATLQTLRTPPVGVRAYNLAMPDSPTWNRYFRLMANALGAVPVKRIGARRMKLETTAVAVALTGWGKMVKTLPPVIPPSLARLWRHDITLDSTRATRELGVQWTSIEDGIAESVRSLA